MSLIFWLGTLIVMVLYLITGAICIWQGWPRALKVVEDCYWSILGFWWVLYGLLIAETGYSWKLYVLGGCGFFFLSIIMLVRHWLKDWDSKDSV